MFGGWTFGGTGSRVSSIITSWSFGVFAPYKISNISDSYLHHLSFLHVRLSKLSLHRESAQRPTLTKGKMSDANTAPEMSSATKQILGKVQRMIPPMLDKFHKGI
jgi:hypothetical protein